MEKEKLFYGVYGGVCGYVLFRLWFLLWDCNLTLTIIWSNPSRYYNIGVTILLVLSCFIPAVYSYKNYDDIGVDMVDKGFSVWFCIIAAPLVFAAETAVCISIVYLIFFKFVVVTIALLVIFAIACLANPAATIETASGAIVATLGSAPIIIPAIIAIIIACVLGSISS